MPIKDEKKKKEAQQRADAKRAGKRARAWTAMMYQESAPDGWKDKLADLLVEALVSPLHDQDVWTDEDEAENPVHKAGSPKKAHWHIVVSYKNPVTFAKAREVFDEIGAVVPPEPKAKVKDFQQMARYLCHLDQPKKHRYDPADVQAFGALDYQRLIMAGRDEDNLLDEMMEYIDENCITSFRQFCVYVRKTGVASAGLSPVCGTHQQVHKVACMGDGAREPEMKKGGAVSPAFFGVLGAKPLTSGGK